MTRGGLLIDIAPADSWEDGFLVGNGRHGALVHGRPGAERVVVTHHDLTWPDATTGGPPDLADRLPRVRELLLAGESGRALELFTGGWPAYHPRPFHPALAIVVRLDPSSPDARPDGYRRTLSYRAGVAVTRWRSRRHACFVSRVRDLVVQQVTGATPWDAVVETDARLPGAPAGLRVGGQVRSRAPGDAVIETTVRYPAGDEGYVVVTRVTATAGQRTTSSVGEHAVRVTGGGDLVVLSRVEAFDRAAGIGAARARALAAVCAVPASEPRPLLAEHARAHAAAIGDVTLDLGVDAAERRLAHRRAPRPAGGAARPPAARPA